MFLVKINYLNARNTLKKLKEYIPNVIMLLILHKILFY